MSTATQLFPFDAGAFSVRCVDVQVPTRMFHAGATYAARQRGRVIEVTDALGHIRVILPDNMTFIVGYEPHERGWGRPLHATFEMVELLTDEARRNFFGE